MATEIRCPGCQSFFAPSAASGCIQCPKCNLAFMPLSPASISSEIVDLQVADSAEVAVEGLVPINDGDLRRAPSADFDDGGFALAPDDADDDGDMKKSAAQQQLQAAQAALKNNDDSEKQDTFLEKIGGQAESSTRHFKTVIIGFGILFGGMVGLAGIASHIAHGRMSALPVVFLFCVMGVGALVIVYGVCRGAGEMIFGLFRGKQRPQRAVRR